MLRSITYPKPLQERSEVTPGSKSENLSIRCLPRLGGLIGGHEVCINITVSIRAFVVSSIPERFSRFCRMRDVLRTASYQVSERWRCTSTPLGACHRAVWCNFSMNLSRNWNIQHTNVDVCHDIVRDPLREVFRPFSTADKSILMSFVSYHVNVRNYVSDLFSIPTHKHDVPQRFPTIFQEHTETSDDFVQRCGSRGRVCRAHDPSYKRRISATEIPIPVETSNLPSRCPPISTVSFLICPGIAATAFHIGITLVSTVERL